MKKIIVPLLCLSLTTPSIVIPQSASAAKATETISYTYDAGRWNTYTRQMEKLDRGLVAVRTSDGVFLSWRLLDSEDTRFGSGKSNVSFNIYRGSKKIDTVSSVTNYTDTTAGANYSVAPVINGVEGAKCEAVSVQSNNYFDIPIQKPANITLADGNSASYTANDASCGDIDGDGEYEIVLKWDANGQDNSKSGYTGNVILDAYKLDGTRLWRVDLGQNVRGGAHYTQFLVYDFDGDGKAEMTCQTAPGSKDSAGNYVTAASHVDAIKSYTDAQNQESYINEGGYNLTSDEFLTVFESDGTAADTIYYPNQRVSPAVWGDDYGNRCDRFTATVAYMDGVTPYAVYMRGYYFGNNGQQREAACAVSYNGTALSCNHSFDTFNPASYRYKSGSSSYDSEGNYKGVDGYKQEFAKYVGNGNHNCSTADTDNDGKDEVMTGSLCYEFKEDNSLGVKWCTFLEHGDALHIGDYDPTHEGFEFFTVHEDGGPNTMSGKSIEIGFGMSVIDPGVDAQTPSDSSYSDLIMFHETAAKDTGRGVMANIGMGGYYQIWSAQNSNLYMSNGGTNYTAGSKNGLSQNFRIFWDGDLYDELLDGTSITKYNPESENWWSPVDTLLTASNCNQVNGTKANPALQADLFGDWREEVVYPTSNNSALRVFTTTTPTKYKIKTLMQDPVYRVGVSAEQTSYNQPPHVGLYLNDELFVSNVESISVDASLAKTTFVPGEAFSKEGLIVTAHHEDGTASNVETYTVSGYNPSKIGEQTITVTYQGFTATYKVMVKEISGISLTPPANTNVYQGGTVDLTGLVVTAHYTDNSSGPVNDYTVLDYDNTTLGKQTVTVSYNGKTASFTITVLEASLDALSRSFVTDSTDSTVSNLQIGTYSGDFTIEHKVKINSMPANGSTGKNDTSGFFLRFMNPEESQTGGGWYLTDDNGQAKVVWKSTQTKSIGSISIGQDYTFRYEFKNVGTGSGASVAFTILSSDGIVVGKGENLNLRNFTDTTTGVTSSITAAQVYNQAIDGQTASVTFSNARLVVNGVIKSVDAGSITIDVDELDKVKAYAVKYADNGTVDKTAVFTPSDKGENVFNANFNPDKIFLWNGMTPIDIWE